MALLTLNFWRQLTSLLYAFLAIPSGMSQAFSNDDIALRSTCVRASAERARALYCSDGEDDTVVEACFDDEEEQEIKPKLNRAGGSIANGRPNYTETA